MHAQAMSLHACTSEHLPLLKMILLDVTRGMRECDINLLAVVDIPAVTQYWQLGPMNHCPIITLTVSYLSSGVSTHVLILLFSSSLDRRDVRERKG